MRRADVRAWLHRAALDVARLAERRETDDGPGPAGRGEFQPWADAGIDFSEVPYWRAAGCIEPEVARELHAVGLRPRHLLHLEGLAGHGRSRCPTAIVTAVVKGEISAEEAAALVAGLSLLRWRAAQRLCEGEMVG